MVVAFILLVGQLGVIAPGVPSSSTPAASPPSSGPMLTLSAAVERARTASPSRRAAAVTAESASDASRSAGRRPNPFFDWRLENWSPAAQRPSPPLDVYAVVTQPFELGGKRMLRRQLATSDGEVARTALLSVERAIALDTVRAYVRALRARALVETLTGNRQGLAMLIESVGRQVDEGYSPEADLLKFRTEAARVDGDIARAQLELERSLSALAVLIGSDTPIRPTQLVEPAALPVPTADTRAIAAAVAHHPGVLEANATIERARQVTALERAKRLVDPMVTGGYKRTAGFDTMVLGVSVALPLFDRNTTSITRAAGVEHSAIAERDALTLQLTTDAASAVRAARIIAERAGAAERELLAPAEEVRHSALAAFREGTADVLRLIDAERVYADVRRAAIDLRLDALLMTIEARFSLGEEVIP